MSGYRVGRFLPGRGPLRDELALVLGAVALASQVALVIGGIGIRGTLVDR